MIDSLLWWTGFFFWAVVAGLVLTAGLPDGQAIKGVARLTFYDLGPVVWRVTPSNARAFANFRKAGYHFLHVGGTLHLGMSLPRWLALLIDGRRRASRGGTGA